MKSHQNKWHAPQGYRKIKENYEFETIKEAVSRRFNEEIQVTNVATDQKYDYYDIQREHHLNLSNYVEYIFDEKRSGDGARHIGLFMIEIDESKLKFALPDTYENQVFVIRIFKYSHRFCCRTANGSD